jgi:hypothetical protein
MEDTIRKRYLFAAPGLLIALALGGCDLDPEPEIPEEPGDLPAPVADRVDTEAVPFAPGIIPTDGDVRSVVVGPGGERVYLAKSVGEDGAPRLWESVWDEEASAYGDPMPLHFSEVMHLDRTPALAPGGDYLAFSSARPVAEGDGVLESFNIWVAEWVVPEAAEGPEAGDWGYPWSIRTLVSPAWDGAPSLAANGNVYFASERDAPTAGSNLFVADFREGDWLAPEPLEVPLSSSADDTDPWVAHDESFLLFASDRGGDGFDLYVAFRTEFGGWLDPLPLGDAVNTEADETAPSMTHDGNYLLFHREGAGVVILPAAEADITSPGEL